MWQLPGARVLLVLLLALCAAGDDARAAPDESVTAAASPLLTVSLSRVATIPEATRRVSLDGRVAYVFNERGDNETLSFYDLALPAAPRRIAELNLADLDGWTVTRQTLYAFEGDGSGSTSALRTFDVADPKQPRPLGRVALPDNNGIGMLVLDGDRLYVDTYSTNTVTLQTIELADPAQPRLLGSCCPRASYFNLRGIVSASVAYLAGDYKDNDPWLEILDLADPGNPRPLSRLDGVRLFPLRVIGKVLYAYESDSTYLQGLARYDVSNPAQPRRLPNLALPTGRLGSPPLIVEPGVALISTDTGIEAYDVRPDVVPGATPLATLSGTGDLLAFDNNLLLVGSGDADASIDVVQALIVERSTTTFVPQVGAPSMWEPSLLSSGGT